MYSQFCGLISVEMVLCLSFTSSTQREILSIRCWTSLTCTRKNARVNKFFEFSVIMLRQSGSSTHKKACNVRCSNTSAHTDLREEFLEESTGLHRSDDSVMAELIGEGLTLQAKQIKKSRRQLELFCRINHFKYFQRIKLCCNRKYDIRQLWLIIRDKYCIYQAVFTIVKLSIPIKT